MSQKLVWTEEEKATLVQAWQDWTGPSGQARRGFLNHLQTLYPHRSRQALRNIRFRLVREGRVPRQWYRREHVPLILSPAEAAWLAGILDGEGSIDNYDSKDGRCKKRKWGTRMLRVTVCANTDEGILRRAQHLLPAARRYLRPPCGFPTKSGKRLPCFTIAVYGYRDILDFFHHVLPYMAHEPKRLKALAMVEYIRGRLATRGLGSI